METIDIFRPKYQAFLENNMSARAFCWQIGLLYDVKRKADDENLTYDERRDLRMRLAVTIL